MAPDLVKMNVLKTAGSGFTYTQQRWHPFHQECYEQLMTKRSQKETLGPNACICWTDHANVIHKANKIRNDPVPDAKIQRWVTEVIADGSCMRTLAGRAMCLADGISRNPPDRDALLARRTADMMESKAAIREFDIDEFAGETDFDSKHPWSRTEVVDANPNTPSGAAAVAWASSAVAALRAPIMPGVCGYGSLEAPGQPLRIAWLVPECTHAVMIRDLAAERAWWNRNFPTYSVELIPIEGPFKENHDPSTPEKTGRWTNNLYGCK